jgi:hypothetical protein
VVPQATCPCNNNFIFLLETCLNPSFLPRTERSLVLSEGVDARKRSSFAPRTNRHLPTGSGVLSFRDVSHRTRRGALWTGHRFPKAFFPGLSDERRIARRAVYLPWDTRPSQRFIFLRHSHSRIERTTLYRFNDPSAGSPTETLLRLLLPLNDQVWPSFQEQLHTASGVWRPSPKASLNHSIGSSDGRCVQRAGT